MSEVRVIGADIGGTHITAAAVNLLPGTVHERSSTRKAVLANGAKEEIISTWAQAIREAAGGKVVAGMRLGIAMPGPFDYAQGISLMQNQDKYDALYMLDVKDLLALELQLEPAHIRFLNDAACFLQGEVFGGAAKGAARAIGLTLGTGLGSAKYQDGLAADAALWCAPFKDGVAEEYISARWLIRRYQELTGQKVRNVKEMVGKVSAESKVLQAFQEFGQHLGEFLLSFIGEAESEVVVIGGNIANSLDLFRPAMEQALAENGIIIPIKQAQLGEYAALIGAASLWKA
ncbi:glucokinase [Pontibacter ummariensis]|uniref:Glucokinase n=2 Tax=Pontibacter ummariensis TaxID=1610492 RepID=A0A239GIZ3_9BACT|nr:glucokinase [Pontibacter ummariensis]SNS69109.1 glucokinase [Pontibacter ummariensis]